MTSIYDAIGDLAALRWHTYTIASVDYTGIEVTAWLT
jgi:hypothetical protein